MKLFIWANPYDVPYGSSMVFAVAEDVEQAKSIAAGARSYCFDRETGDSMARQNLGDPTRVLDLPCAEWHEWSE